jgi:dihydropteroate synthase
MRPHNSSDEDWRRYHQWLDQARDLEARAADVGKFGGEKRQREAALGSFDEIRSELERLLESIRRLERRFAELIRIMFRWPHR